MKKQLLVLVIATILGYGVVVIVSITFTTKDVKILPLTPARAQQSYATSSLIKVEKRDDQILLRNLSPWIVTFKVGCSEPGLGYFIINPDDTLTAIPRYNRFGYCLSLPKTHYVLPGDVAFVTDTLSLSQRIKKLKEGWKDNPEQFDAFAAAEILKFDYRFFRLPFLENKPYALLIPTELLED